jgi:hypothetical protein
MTEPLPLPAEEIMDHANLDPHTEDASFLEQAYLSYLVPYKTNVDFDELFEEARSKSPLDIDDIEQRESLFFGLSLLLCSMD